MASEPGTENVYKQADESELEKEEMQVVGQDGFIAPGQYKSVVGATAEEKKLLAEIQQLKDSLRTYQIAAGGLAILAGVAVFRPQWLKLR